MTHTLPCFARFSFASRVADSASWVGKAKEFHSIYICNNLGGKNSIMNSAAARKGKRK